MNMLRCCCCVGLGALAASSALAQDPHLKPGFPVNTLRTGGTAIGTYPILVAGDMDGNPGSEFVTTGIMTGPLYAWYGDGSEIPGWPFGTFPGYQHPVMGKFLPDPGFQVFTQVLTSASGQKQVLLRPDGTIAPGWPKSPFNYTSSPGTAADLDDDRFDEILTGSENRTVYAYRASGANFPGWPRLDEFLNAGQKRDTPFYADLDGDSVPEIITQCEQTSQGRTIFVYRRDGTTVPGFPVTVQLPITVSALGDLDGDGYPEMICPIYGTGTSLFMILNHDGSHRLTFSSPVGENFWNCALADMNGDNLPEIVVNDSSYLHVFDKNGNDLPGWPRMFSNGIDRRDAHQALVGDVDGDGFPDIVLPSRITFAAWLGEVRAYNRFGEMLPGFPKVMELGGHTISALADIDGDGRTDILANGNSNLGGPAFFPRVWAFDLQGANYGPIHWGQWLGGPKHHGIYVPVVSTVLPRATSLQAGTLLQGDAESIRREDGATLRVRPGIDGAVVEITGYPMDLTPTGVSFKVTSFADRPGVIQEIYLYDFVAGEWNLARSTVLSEGLGTVIATPSGGAERYFQLNSRQLRARVRWWSPGSKTGTRIGQWQVALDRAVWDVTRR